MVASSPYLVLGVTGRLRSLGGVGGLLLGLGEGDLGLLLSRRSATALGLGELLLAELREGPAACAAGTLPLPFPLDFATQSSRTCRAPIGPHV